MSYLKLLAVSVVSLFVCIYFGCASHSKLTADRTYFELQPIAPLSELDGVQISDNLVVKVENVADLGPSYKNRLELYVNDKLIKPESDEYNYQKAYRYSMKLQPGIYKVRAFYYASDGWREKKYQILTRQDVKILPNTKTQLSVVIEKDWRGVPISDDLYFNVSQYEPLADRGLNKSELLAIPAQDPGGDVKAGKKIDTDAMEKSVPAREIGPPLPPTEVETRADRRAVAPSKMIELQINTIPSGADVMVDDLFVGQTPLKIYVDRSKSHVIQMCREGHRDFVKLLDFRQFEGQNVIFVMQKLDPVL